jgi:hypothetical protein
VFLSTIFVDLEDTIDLWDTGSTEVIFGKESSTIYFFTLRG